MDKVSITGILGLSLLISLLLISSVFGAEKDLVIKMATLAPEGSSWIKAFNTVNAEVRKKSENKVQFKIYPGGVLGDESDMLRKMKIGQIQGVALTSAGLSSIFNEIDVLQVPFLFQKYDEVDYVFTKMDAFFRKGFEDNGYVPLGWSGAGFVYLMSTLPVYSVTDLKKAKVWILEDSNIAKAIFQEAGVKAIPLSIPDVLVGLQTGLVEVVYVPPTAAISLQWFTKIKYITDVPLLYVAGAILLRKETFREIPSTFQPTLMEIAQRHLNQLKTVTRNENRDALQVMAKQGIKIITPSRDQIDEFKKLSSRAMAQPGSQSFSKKTLEEVLSLLDSYRKGGK
ncbi:MAG TPA: TRAP transporter substrate-binding protein DctP [Thermodesulfobacteriota bacterium]|nr:TRAP transporter substrate-binding protein DctP [Thermodesulfobacteriota bacterium]